MEEIEVKIHICTVSTYITPAMYYVLRYSMSDVGALGVSVVGGSVCGEEVVYGWWEYV